jgi:hypothetical protein
MKRIIFIWTIVSMVFAGCTKEDELTIQEAEFPSLKVKMKFDTDGEGPRGTMYLFYLSDIHVDNLRPQTMLRPSEFCILQDVNGEPIAPKYSYEIKSDKDSVTGKYVNSSTVEKYLHGYKDGDYLIVLCLVNSGYSMYGNVTYKKIAISKNNSNKVLNENINTYEYLISLEKVFNRDLDIGYGEPGWPNQEEW